MKNIRENQLKKCIFKEYEDFKKDVVEALGNDVKVDCDYDGIYFECDEEPLYTEEVLEGMSKYYNAKVTSIHIDDCEYVGVWIVYK